MSALDKHIGLTSRSLRRLLFLCLTIVLLLFALKVQVGDVKHSITAVASQLSGQHRSEPSKVGTPAQSNAPSAFPKIIHQIWETEMVPQAYENWIRSWVKFHPASEWQYYFWTAKGRNRFTEKYYPDIDEKYKKMGEKIWRADLSRILIIHHYGGMYADLDEEALGSYDEYVRQNPCFVASNQPLHNPWDHGKQAINCLFGCTPRHELYEQLIEEVKVAKDQPGPHLFNRVFKAYNANNKSDVTLADPEIFVPNLDMPIQKQLLEKLCFDNATLEKLGPMRKRDCLRLRMTKMANFPPTNLTLAYHYWSHTYIHPELFTAKQINISTIIPHVRFGPL